MDKQFKNFLAEARRLNIPYSVYIFSTAENENEASTEGKQIVSWYKDLNLKDKLPNMTYDEKIKLLSCNGMLVKRPIFIYNGNVLLGFKKDIWKDIIK